MSIRVISPRWASSFFFSVCGIAYGSVMSRMPAIRQQAFLADQDVGFVLLCMGIGGLVSFPVAGWAITKFGCRRMLISVSSLLIVLLPFMGISTSLYGACALFACLGFSIGLNDVAINTESIIVETALRKPVISSMHAMYSAGGLIGALMGSFMAGGHVPPFWNFTGIACLLLIALPFFSSALMDDPPSKSAGESSGSFQRPPAWLLFTGLLLLCSYSTEGSVGEWGVLLLHDTKGAAEETAALVYAAFSVSMTLMRFLGDRLREYIGDAFVMRLGAAFAFLGITCGIYSPWVSLCLAGYLLLGVGLSITVPILFSTLGAHNEIPTGYATTVLSMIAASGQLFIPPLIGMLGDCIGLLPAMNVIVFLCAVMVAGSGIVRNRKTA